MFYSLYKYSFVQWEHYSTCDIYFITADKGVGNEPVRGVYEEEGVGISVTDTGTWCSIIARHVCNKTYTLQHC